MKPEYQEAIDRAFQWMKSGHRTREDKTEYLRVLNDEQTAFRVVAVLAGDYSKVSESCLNAVEVPRHYRWRIRKELSDGMFSACEYNARTPVAADDVAKAPSVIEWLGSDKLDEIYHPE